jgi:DNA segregation ATPase FtsK/SpoIIIE-like protein
MQDELLEQAKEWSRKKGFVSVSYLQRIMRLNYPRVRRMVDTMIENGFCKGEFMAGSHTHAIIEAVEHGVQPTPESGRDLPVESNDIQGSAPAESG